MRVEKQKESLVLSENASGDSVGMSLDLDSAQFLMQMLSKTLYSDGVGSPIRETVSNALDSHRKAGVDKPIVVSFKQGEGGNYEFSVEDFGIGLDHKDVWEIISKYGKSTKRESDEELGLFGLGFKSPLAYSSSFYFTVRKDGIERKYMMYEGEEVNTIDLLHETETDKPDGTKVVIPVKYSDRDLFYTKIKEQLAYFEDVYFDVTVGGHYSWSESKTISNNFSILRHELFQKSDLATDKYLHLCLDNVYYPLDFDKLGIDRIELPVGLRFNLTDGIYPIPNRETIRYTQEAKEVILSKIKELSTHFVTEYNNKLKKEWDVMDVIKYYKEDGRWYEINGEQYNIEPLENYSDVKFEVPAIDKISMIDLNDLINNKLKSILGEYNIRFEINSNRFEGTNGSLDYYLRNWDSKYKFYKFTSVSGKMKEYMKYLCEHDFNKSYKFVKKTTKRKLRKSSWHDDVLSYYEVLSLNNHDKSEWRQRIQEFQYFESLILDKFYNLDDVKFSDDWLESRKKKRISLGYQSRGRKLEGEVVGKQAEDLRRFVDGQDCKFVPTTYKLEGIHKIPSLIVYTDHESKAKLDKLYKLSSKQKIRFVTFSNREIKTLSKIKIHNLINYKKFMKGENKPFKRIVTAYLINKLVSEYQYVFNNRDAIKKVSVSMFDKLTVLSEYSSKHYNYNGNDAMYTAMLEVAENNNLFDYTIYPEYLEMKGLLKKLDFLNPLLKVANGSSYSRMNNDDMHNILCSLFKYYKHRIDYTNYNIKIEEEEEEKKLSEEIVEELVNN